MDWNLVLSAALIAIGIFILFMLERSKKGDTYMYVALITGIALVVAGGWLLTRVVPSAVIQRKFWGFIVTLFGAGMIFGFPGTSEYQTPEFGYTGVLIGIIALIAGIYLLIF